MQKTTYEIISQRTNDPIVERKTCKVSGNQFPIYQSDLNFYEKISPVFNGVKCSIPTPTFSPEERARRRLSFRNERKLYRRTCDASGKAIISIYSSDKPFKVYDQKVWRSDQRNGLEYGRDYNFNQTFTENFRELLLSVPRPSLIGANNENAEYINLTADSKNCYMVIESSNAENCLYGYRLQRCTNCLDSNFSESCEVCYEIDNCFRCYQCFHSVNLKDSSNCWYCNTCYNCSFCFGCADLQNQSYCIYNKQVSKEEFQLFMTSYTTNDYLSVRNQYPEIKNQIRQSENSAGNYLRNTKNCQMCYDGYDAEDCKYGEHIRRNAKNCVDVSTSGRDAEMIYECINTGIGVQSDLFCTTCWSSHTVLYSDICFNSDHLFGCVGLRNQSYCIFNKQYTKEEYERLVPRIIEKMQEGWEWWEFFHPSLSPFGYNESVANEQYPLENVLAYTQYGYQWSDFSADPKIPEHSELVYPAKYSDSEWKALVDDDEIVRKVFICSVSGRPFILQKMEVAFYRKHHLPLPKLHPDIRHQERMQLRSMEMFMS